jgi:hypothetical protein
VFVLEPFVIPKSIGPEQVEDGRDRDALNLRGRLRREARLIALLCVDKRTAPSGSGSVRRQGRAEWRSR